MLNAVDIGGRRRYDLSIVITEIDMYNAVRWIGGQVYVHCQMSWGLTAWIATTNLERNVNAMPIRYTDA